MWIEEETGKTLPGTIEDAPPPGAVWIEDDDVPVEPEHGEKDMSWVPNWLAKQLLHLEAEERAIRTHLSEMLRAIRGREQHLHWCYDQAAEAVVKGDLLAQNEGKKRKKKSVSYPFGKAGWRASKRIDVSDEEAAIAWARDHSPEAVKTVTTVSLLKSMLPAEKVAGGEVPGVTRTEEERFFLAPSRPK